MNVLRATDVLGEVESTEKWTDTLQVLVSVWDCDSKKNIEYHQPYPAGKTFAQC